MIIQDTGYPFAANLVANGATNVFDLPVESISSVANPPLVYVGYQLVPYNQATPQYTFDYKHGVLIFPTSPAAGTDIAVQGTTYAFFDDDEVTQAVTDAFNLHVADQDPLPTIDPTLGGTSLSSSEEYLVAILAAVELLWFRATDASQQIDIHTPEGVTIPRAQRFQQITAQINALQAEYKTIAGALGVGLWRIQVLFQRRVSYTTNRLTPLFREQEYNAPYSGFQPTAGAVGTTVSIMGEYFTGTTEVSFGGIVSQSFTVVSDTQIDAVVPPGAVTGQIGIVTPGGAVLTTAQFVVGTPAPFVLFGPEMVKPTLSPGV